MRTLAAALLLTACGPSDLEPTNSAVQALILEPVCATAGCHMRPQPQQGLDLSDIDATLETTVDVAPTVGRAAEVYDALIVPGDPDGSFLLTKVMVPGIEQGVAMPPSDEQLTAEAIDVLREWILQMPEGGE